MNEHTNQSHITTDGKNPVGKVAFPLASIFAFRMLGLFMILPVFAIYAHTLKHATPFLIGMALGIYGLTQAMLQIPFGMISDRIGRKKVIAFGLLLFIIGSIIAALSHSITGIIIGRAIQGAGAVGSTIIALVADLTREEQRTKAMAIIGMTIGLAFSIALFMGPLLNGWIGVPGIFWLTAILGGLGIVVLYVSVPKPTQLSFHRDAEPVPSQFLDILKNPELLRLDLGIFVLHCILTACFLVLPIALQNNAGLPEAKQWHLYLPVLLLAFIAMFPGVIIAEKHRKIKQVFVFAIVCLGIAICTMIFAHHSLLSLAIGLFIFFTAFTMLEALLPSLISKVAPITSKGTAMGIYSSAQFLGIFIGGAVGGWIYGLAHIVGVLIFCLALIVLWLLVAAKMKQPAHLGSHLINIGDMSKEQAIALKQRFLQTPGVAEASVFADDGVAYLKVDNRIVNKDDLNKMPHELRQA